jgi:hypothetical protein
MQMKTLWLAMFVLGGFAVGAASAQESASEEGEAVQRELERKALHIPARDLAAALRASKDGRSNRARTISRGPDLQALREDLQHTRNADAERQTARAPEESAATPIRRRPSPPPGLRALADDRLTNVKREEIERVFVPMLIPAHPDILDNINIYGMRNIYTAIADIDANASFSMTGTCNRVIGGDPNNVAFRKRLAENPPRLPGTGAEFHISRNDYGVDLSFSKFGCGYVMTIECGDPGGDLRCAADDDITNLADSLMLANPALAGGE